MKQRCYSQSNELYIRYYGSRGVVVCDEWKNNFKAFYDWAILNGWQKGMNLDKDIIAKEKGIEGLIYSPEYCQFVTHKLNCNNTRKNSNIEFNGKVQSITMWADEMNMNPETIHARLYKFNWSIERALTTPAKIYKYIK